MTTTRCVRYAKLAECPQLHGIRQVVEPEHGFKKADNNVLANRQ